MKEDKTGKTLENISTAKNHILGQHNKI